MQTSTPTRGQLERTLTQRIQSLYRTQLGHGPSQVTCHLLDDKIVIVLEGSITRPEQLLVDAGKEKQAEQLREDLDEALQPGLRELIEEVVEVPVIDLISSATLETGRTGTIAVLADSPRVR